MVKKSIIILIWIISLVLISLHVHENPEQVERIKDYFKKYQKPNPKFELGGTNGQRGNSFLVKFNKKVSFTGKTSFIFHDENILNFDENALKIYYQNGYFSNSFKSEKFKLPSSFTTARNGGIKTVFIYKEIEFGLISSLKDGCFYASIVLLSNGKELFNTACLPNKNIDFNGLGSSSIHLNDKILLSIGTPEQASLEIRKLAQDKNSMFGKIIELDKNNLDKIIANEVNNLEVKIFTMGHRNPQGLTKINESFFGVEHGPKGGDELNKIIQGTNYGWPKVSYGTQYMYDESGKSYEISHENSNFEEPLFALVPSVGISGLNTCPKILKNYYKKPCLLALSLYGNKLRAGKSIIIFLLNEKMNKVHSIEKILLRNDLKLRHFVTNSRNELYEDANGNIYISADRKGIYEISFKHFRK